MTNSNAEKRKYVNLMFLGIMSIIFGLLALMTPLIVGIAIVMTLGIALLILGISEVFAGFSDQKNNKLIILGILCTLGGLVLLIYPKLILGALTLTIGIIIGVLGASRIAFALRFKEYKSFLLISGVISILFAFLIIIKWPNSSEWVLGTLIGIDFILQGIGLILADRFISSNENA